MNGIQLPFSPISALPEYLANTILGTKLEAPDMVSLRWEVQEDGLTTDELRMTKEGQERERFTKITPREGLALIVGAIFFRAYQDYSFKAAQQLIEEGGRSNHDPLVSRIDRFFRLNA